MDLEMTRIPIAINRPVFSGSSEQPIDLDIALPDYCPDIARILKCQAVPQVTARSLVGDRLTVEGSTILRLLYADEGGALRCCELSSAFSTDFAVRTVPEQPAVFTNVRVDFMNCRAVTKRRVDIHCAFTVTVQVWARQAVELLQGASGGDIRVQTRTVQTCTHVGTVQQPISLSAEFAPENGAQPETILYFSAAGTLTDRKQVADKWVLKGCVQLHVLYATDARTGDTCTIGYEVPFSTIVDLEGLDDGCASDVRLEVLSVQVQLRSGEGGTVFGAEIRGAVCVTALRTQTVQLVTDAYDAACELNVETETLALPVPAAPLERSVLAKGTVDCGAGAEVLDAWAEVRSVTGTYRDGTLALSGKVCAAVLFRNAEGAADYREALLDFEDSAPCAADGEWTLRAQVDRIAYRVTGSAIEMRADVTVASPAMAMQSCTVLRSMTPDPQRPKAQDASCALILYYAAGGERLWDIARQYNTTEAAIRAENELTGDVIEQAGMLLIPIV